MAGTATIGWETRSVPTITQVQKKSYGSVGTGNTHTITADSAITAGNLMILVVVCTDEAVNPPSGWIQAAYSVDFTGTYIWYKIAGGSESTSIAVTVGGPTTTCCLGYMEYSGIYSATPLDEAIGVIGQGGTINTGSITTIYYDLLVALAGVSDAAGNTWGAISSWDNSFTEQLNATTSGGDVIRLSVATKVAAAGTYTANATVGSGTGTANNCGAIAGFIAS